VNPGPAQARHPFLSGFRYSVSNPPAFDITVEFVNERAGVGFCAMEPIIRDVRLALRRLRIAPGFTVFAVVSLALGIGVSTAIYSAVRTLLWAPLGIVEPARAVSWTEAGRFAPSLSWPDFVDIRAQQASFTSVAAARRWSTALALGGTVETVFGESVSGEYFATLGVNALHGRVLQPQDEASTARVAVVSESFWRTRLDADPAAVGLSFKLGGETFDIVGVARGAFRGVHSFIPVSVWILEVAVPDKARTGWPARLLTDRRLRSFSVWSRLRPGVSLSEAAAEATVIAQRLDVTFPVTSPFAQTPGVPVKRGWTLRAGIDAGGEVDRLHAIGSIILLAVVMVLLIACTNLANLSLAKGTSRAHETAVRTALGASRWRLIREQLVESAVVTAGGGVLGVILLVVLTDWFATDLPVAQGMVIRFIPEVSMEVLGASAGATMLALLVFGLWPAVQSTRHDVRTGLGAGGGATPTKWRLHRSLVAWQVGGSVAVLLVAAMCVEVVASVGGTDPGVDYRRLALAQLDFAMNGRDEGRARFLLDQILAEASRQPGIESVSASTGLPFGVMAPPTYVTTEEQPFTETRDVGEYAHRIAATPEILRTLGMQVVRGRGITNRDDAAASRVAVLSEGLSRELFHSTDVVGRRILMGPRNRLVKSSPPELFTVVGVSKETDTFMLGRRGNPVLFVPLAQAYDSAVTISARAADPSAAAAVLRSAIRKADPELALLSLGTGVKLLSGPYFLLRIVAGFASALGALALALAMAGLYGVLAHVVARRTREIGIRIAMGADRSRIFALILRDGLRPVVSGLVLGLVAGVVFRIALRSTIFTGISPVDPLTFALVPIPFVIAALMACYVPASRASRVEPTVALRDL
jgi:predicted permease